VGAERGWGGEGLELKFWFKKFGSFD
jgi:hypothetical protein